jgi:exonuclease VII small subunit
LRRGVVNSGLKCNKKEGVGLMYKKINARKTALDRALRNYGKALKTLSRAEKNVQKSSKKVDAAQALLDAER